MVRTSAAKYLSIHTVKLRGNSNVHDPIDGTWSLPGLFSFLEF